MRTTRTPSKASFGRRLAHTTRYDNLLAAVTDEYTGFAGGQDDEARFCPASESSVWRQSTCEGKARCRLDSGLIASGDSAAWRNAFLHLRYAKSRAWPNELSGRFPPGFYDCLTRFGFCIWHRRAYCVPCSGRSGRSWRRKSNGKQSWLLAAPWVLLTSPNKVRTFSPLTAEATSACVPS